MKKVLIIFIYLFLISVNTHAEEKQPSSNSLFEIGGVIISPGEIYRGNLRVSKVNDAIESSIPITVTVITFFNL
tara:strand:+ start:3428 stop:3649 length:222 start_codon:yes stop_codon:yes gene_type:complete